LCFIVDENGEDADYDNVPGRRAIVVNENNVGSDVSAETGSPIHSDQLEPPATETVPVSEATKQSGNTKVKKEKKMFSWGRKKKKKPKTAAGIHCDCSD